jgi:uncharacterized protein
MNVYLDTSAVVKLYYKEAGSENLLAFLKLYTDDLILTVADISKTEFHSALLRRVRTGEIALDDVYNTFKGFDRDFNMFNIITVNDTVKQLAVMLLDQIAYQRGLRTLDAFQLATAIACNRFIKIDTFITSDQRFLNIAQEYFVIFNPED